MLRTATEAMTPTIAADIDKPKGLGDGKEEVQAVAQAIQHGLNNHEGKGYSGGWRREARAVMLKVAALFGGLTRPKCARHRRIQTREWFDWSPGSRPT